MAFTLRFDPTTIKELDEMAEQHGMNRKEILTHMVNQALQQGIIPRRPGEGLAFSSNGGSGLLAIIGNDVILAADSLTAEETEIVRQAQSLAQHNQWGAAKLWLTQAGFAVTFK